MAAAAPSAGRDELTRNPLACCSVCCSSWCLRCRTVRIAAVAFVSLVCRFLVLCCMWVRRYSSCGCCGVATAFQIFCRRTRVFSRTPKTTLSAATTLFFSSNQTPSLTKETPVILLFPIPLFIFSIVNVLVDADRWRWATAGNYRHRYYR
ncbi:hypothetical protein ACLKA6_017250 [Drosophila palustris]